MFRNEKKINFPKIVSESGEMLQASKMSVGSGRGREDGQGDLWQAGQESLSQGAVREELQVVSGIRKASEDSASGRAGPQIMAEDFEGERKEHLRGFRPEEIWLEDLEGFDVAGFEDNGWDDLSEDNRLLVEMAKGFLSQVPKPDCGVKTAREYLKIFNRVFRDGTVLKDLRSKSTYYKYRSALQSVGGVRLAAVVEKVHQGRTDGPVVDCLRNTMAVLHQAGVLERVAGCPIENPIPKKGKRRSLGIPRWRERLWERAYERFTNYCAPLAILHLAGVRPDELEKGVWVSSGQDDDHLTLSILGAKTSRCGTKGQPWRQIVISCKDAEYASPRHFLKKLTLANDGVVQVTASAHNLCDFVRRLADQEFGLKRHRISPYSYRHQVAADLKGETGVSKAEIAAILGHQSDRTQKSYGSVRQAGGGNGIIAVKSAKEIRQHTSPGNFPRTGGNSQKSN